MVELSALRNIGIVAHIDAGKTTVSERLLYFSGVEARFGEVHEGSTVLDWMPEERRRGITITAAATCLPWRDHLLNLIDTPGHVDFTVEVERCLRVLDGAVLVLSAIGGVQAQSEAVWRQARRFGVPTITLVNQCDRPGADYLVAVADLEARLEVEALPVHYPLGEGPDLRGVVDLLDLTAWVYDAQGRESRIELPPEVADEAGVLHAELVERLAEMDEAVLDDLAADRRPDRATLVAAVRRATLAGELQPVLCGAALRNIGMQRLLDAVVEFLPGPDDREPPRAEFLSDGSPHLVPPDPLADVCALVFKVQSLDGGPPLLFVRVYAGIIERGARLWIPRLATHLPVEALYRLHADSTHEVYAAGPGEIVALPDTVGATTGDTLCGTAPGLVLESQTFSEPVLTAIVEPEREIDRAVLADSLARLGREDPTLRVLVDAETGQYQVSGMGELHLEVVENRLREQFGIKARFGVPSVAYREAVLTSARGRAEVEREAGARRLKGLLEIELAPDPTSGRLTIDWAPGVELAAHLRESVEANLRRLAQVGPRFGFPLIDSRMRILVARAELADGAEHALGQCASIAAREAMQGVSVELLEPMVDLEVRTPANYAGSALALMKSQRASIGESVGEGTWQVISGRARLAAMSGFSTELRSLSQGRAQFSLKPAGFRPVPASELEALGLSW
ncbi:elongation factor G [Engelhardtia mirabilis]|uniref:Elongation factor G n=1 Tax=Engelhardtia mirabilis TaxID=2528011 RepID=A0A518BPD0_9BACT|nr:Elongation factor G [Planctomycetes bacterium Pla133]QDV03168.1 Elongation factor G [Planctomycetes bacterium Pla86]